MTATQDDPEWTPEKRERFAKLERFEPVMSVTKQRELRDRVRRGELADDVGGHVEEPDHGG